MSDEKKVEVNLQDEFEHSLTASALEKALSEVELQDDDNTEEQIATNMSGSIKQKAKFLFRYLKDKKKELGIGLFFIGVVCMILIEIVQIGMTIWKLDISYSPIPSYTALVLSVLSFSVWAWSTKYPLYNFYKIKRLTFRLCVLHLCISLWQIILKVEMKLLLPFIFLIPTYGGISYSTVVLSAYMFLIAGFVAPFLIESK